MTQRLVCAYAHKYEPPWMIEDLRANLAWVDDFVALDQTDRATELWSRRDERVEQLRQLAVAAGADWCLIMDPDERFERSAEGEIRQAIEGDPTLRYRFPFLELFTPTEYRVDGVWGRKTRRRLFHLRSPMSRRVLLPDARIYHLKMIEPGNRALRARVHTQCNTWDNPNLGFDYLAEDAGAVLEPIPPGRDFQPPYRPYHFEVPTELLADG